MLAPLITFCQPITDQLAANSQGYWQRYRWLIIVCIIAAIGDYITTVRFMQAEGVHLELHPAIRFAADIVGPVLGTAVGKVAQLAAIGLVTLYARRIAPYLFFAATMMYGWAAWYNVWGREIYSPLLFDWLSLGLTNV